MLVNFYFKYKDQKFWINQIWIRQYFDPVSSVVILQHQSPTNFEVYQLHPFLKILNYLAWNLLFHLIFPLFHFYQSEKWLYSSSYFDGTWGHIFLELSIYPFIEKLGYRCLPVDGIIVWRYQTKLYMHVYK